MCVTLENRQSGLPQSALAEGEHEFCGANARSCADPPEGHAGHRDAPEEVEGRKNGDGPGIC
jgi:hypothetical protein